MKNAEEEKRKRVTYRLHWYRCLSENGQRASTAAQSSRNLFVSGMQYKRVHSKDPDPRCCSRSMEVEALPIYSAPNVAGASPGLTC
jgi:hypothetical protein